MNARQLLRHGPLRAHARYRRFKRATINAADLLGRADLVETLEPGTTWIAVDRDPLSDVSVLEHVQFVMKGAKVVQDWKWAQPFRELVTAAFSS